MNFCVTGNNVRNCIAHVRQKEGWRRERSYVVEKIRHHTAFWVVKLSNGVTVYCTIERKRGQEVKGEICGTTE